MKFREIIVVPSYLILDTRNSILTMRSRINNIITFTPNESNVIKLVCELLVNERDAEAELSHDCLSGIVEHPYDFNVEEMKCLANATYNLGRMLFVELKRLKAYQNNHLPFKFYKMVGKDIMLKRENYNESDLQLLRAKYTQLFDSRFRR